MKGQHSNCPFQKQFMNKASILIVDDEPNILKMIGIALEEKEYSVELFSDPVGAVKRAHEKYFDLAFVDLKMVPIDGIKVLEILKEVSKETTVVLMTAFGSIETAVEAIKKGAYDYLTKPFTHKEFLHQVERIFNYHELTKEISNLKVQIDDLQEGNDFITNSISVKNILKTAADIADSDIPVLIEGESGTGKEMLARFIHNNSSRKDKPFIAINCAAIPENLFESELFGYAKGAFTGAIKDRAGRLEMADNGTLFLDEVAEIPKPMQVKLLRFLQNMDLERVGESIIRHMDTRIISATNRDINQDLNSGVIRDDFFYRISGVRFTLPSLRERKEEITYLMRYFLKKYSGKNDYIIEPDVLSLMNEYDWPGNIRELENVVKRLIVFSKDNKIISSYLPVEIKNFSPYQALADIPKLEELEKEHIREVLKIAPGMKEAAKVLGISETTLWRKRKLFNI